MRIEISKLIKFLLKIFSYVFYLLPKRNVVLFIGPGYDKYKDNVRAAFEITYGQAKENGIKYIWITNSNDIFNLIEAKHLCCLKKNTLSAFVAFISAKHIVSGETAPPTLFGFHNFQAKHICLSHGFGPRSTVIADGEIYRDNSSIRISLNKFDRYLFPNNYLALVLGKMQYDMPKEKIFISQQPRLSNTYDSGFDFAINREKTNIFYCPTWRQNGSNPLELLTSNISLDELNILLGQNSCVLWISSHPLVSTSNDYSTLENIQFLDPSVDDPSQFIRLCDLVLSDYSSLITDAISARKPVYLFCPDLNYYQYDYGLNVILKHELDDLCFIDDLSMMFDRIKLNVEQNNSRYYEKFCKSDSVDDFESSFLKLFV